MKKQHDFKYKKFEILAKTSLTKDTVLFKLRGRIDFNPGQFVQVMLPHYGEATFAICSSPENKEYFEICVRACGNTTNRLVELLPGEYIQLRGPYGKGWPVSKLFGKNIILIAGGMGIVPIRPLIYQIIKYRKEFKKIQIISGFKFSDQILFENDFKEWDKKFDLQLYAENLTSPFWGKHGMISKPLEKIVISKNTKALICGPEIMFNFCTEPLRINGLKPEDIYISFERRMECGIGICQHCNIGKFLVCKDGPVFRWDIIKKELMR